MKKPKITVIGSINMDLVTETSQFPKPGETIKGENFFMIPGGKGANQAVAAARLGAEVTLIGCVGNDPFGKKLLDHLKQEGVNIDNVEPVTETMTGIAAITVANMDNSIIVVPGANYHLTPEKIAMYEEIIASSDVLLLQLEIPLITIEKAVEIANKHNVTIILNPAPAQPLPVKLIEKIDFLTPNEHELTYFYNNEVNTIEDLIKKTGEKFIITQGSNGVYFYQNSQTIHIPGFKVEVVDTTGAGDSFNGALAVGLSKGLSLQEACYFGNAVGAISVTKLGAQSGMPTIAEVEVFLADKGNLNQHEQGEKKN